MRMLGGAGSNISNEGWYTEEEETPDLVLPVALCLGTLDTLKKRQLRA